MARASGARACLKHEDEYQIFLLSYAYRRATAILDRSGRLGLVRSKKLQSVNMDAT